jgi:hypothetical protein
LRPLYRRYTALAAHLVDPLERRTLGKEVNRELVAMEWLAHNDARNFIILGDPAVYLLGKRSERDRARRQVAVSPGVPLHLDEAVLAAAREQAENLGKSVEEWINDLLREQLGTPRPPRRESPTRDGWS